MKFNNVLFLIFFIIALIFVNDAQACSYIQPDTFISDISLTEDEDIIFAKIRSSNDKIIKEIAINITTLELIERPDNISSINQSQMHADEEDYTSEYQAVNSSFTKWRLYLSNETLLVDVMLPFNASDYPERSYIINSALGRAYLIVTRYRGVYENALYYSVFFNSSDVVEGMIMWDNLGSAHKVYPNESLLLLYPGCCYCVNSYYYRFNSSGYLEYICTDYLWSSTVIDTRTKNILSISSVINELRIYSYHLDSDIQSVSKIFTETEINKILGNGSFISGFSSMILLNSIIILVIIRRKRS
ncbi:MAG: hypothetical protein ACTSPG_02160 [Candidatus Hodarchaeales archaeon]